MADPARLLTEIEELIKCVEADAQRRFAGWEAWNIQPDFVASAQNLAAYLALRHHDLRDLQRGLMTLGLSSLGRLESRVMPMLASVRSALSVMSGQPCCAAADEAAFFAGERRLAARATRLFGPRRPRHPVALLVTCPSEAADDPAFMLHLAQRGVESVRINCAHDNAGQWTRMIDHARAAERQTGQRLRVFMDLAGPKIRTGAIRSCHGGHKLFMNDRLAVVAPGALEGPLAADIAFACECTLPEALAAAKIGQRLIIDDGKFVTAIEHVRDGTITARVIRCKDGGAKLKPEKGMNFPDTELAIPALTAKDRDDLVFAAAHADGIDFSFVQTPDDVALFQEALAALRPDDWRKMPLVLKIETARAVRNLPEIIVRAAARQPVGVMIARGDLAIEIGFPRLAEMQEEMLWIAEAAQVPVIWATQVLEQLVKEGMPHRGELTDAAMAARAECIMLNKGPYLLEAIDALEPLLGRMDDHLHKKTPQLRSLRSW